MKDLLMQHDSAIVQLTKSIDHLVQAQSTMSDELKETNKRLEEIMRFLAKQQVFQNKIDTMDRELIESFKRVHKRIDAIEQTQVSDAGCNSVKLLNRDVLALTKEVNRLVGIVEEHRLNIEKIDRVQAGAISPSSIKWFVGLLMPVLIAFGSYVVVTFAKIERTNTELGTLLKRDIKDTARLMERIK